MNKRIVTSSLAMVLVTTVVLAIGKTNRPEGAPDVRTVQGIKGAKAPADGYVVAGDADSFDRDIKIRTEIDEGEMILDQRRFIIDPDSPSAKYPVNPLLVSFARMQNALSALEQVAAQTERAVAVLEGKRATQ